MRMFFSAIIVLLSATCFPASCQVDAMQAVLLVDGTQSVHMREVVASRKSHTGLGASKQYFMFEGPKAAIRLKTATPVFQFELEPAFADALRLRSNRLRVPCAVR